MSVESTEIKCSSCGCSGSSGRVNGLFYYYTNGEKISMDRGLAWCESCQAIVAGEIIPTESQYTGLALKLTALRAEIAEEIDFIQSKRSFFSKLFSEPHSQRLILLNDELYWAESKIQDIAKIRGCINSERRPRCLTCGSQKLIYLPPFPKNFDEVWSGKLEFVPLGMKHPSCGGEFILRRSGIRLSILYSEKLYTVEGLPFS